MPGLRGRRLLQDRQSSWRRTAAAAVEAEVVTREAPPPPARRRQPPEPRSRGPQTERDVANDVVFGVVAVELLAKFDRLDEEVGRAFQRAVYDSVMGRLRFYSDPTTAEARSPAKSWRLQDRVLERQFSLSSYFSDRAAVDLRMFHRGETAKPAARVAGRRVLAQNGVEATDDPVSSALIAWEAHAVWVGDSEEPTNLCRGRAGGYAAEKPKVSEWLLPVFVEHDRSSHAERMALLALGETIKNAGGQLHPEAKVRGASIVYASHTPCISCLSVFCQFKRKLPNVRLYYYFDTWDQTRRWVDYSGMKDGHRFGLPDVDEEEDEGKEEDRAGRGGGEAEEDDDAGN